MNYIRDNLESEFNTINRFCFIITVLAVKNILFTIPTVLAISSYVNTVVIAAVVLVFAYEVGLSVHRFKRSVVVSYVIFALFCMLQILIFESNRTYFISILPEIIVYGLIPYSMILFINDYGALLNRLRNVAIAIILFSLLGMLGLVSSGLNYNYSMSYGNFTVIGVGIIEYYMLKERKVKYIILFALGIAELTVGGSRATFLVVVSILILYYLLIYRIKSVPQFLGTFSAVAVLILFIVNFEVIILYVANLLDELGISSRNVFLLTSGEFFTSNSRISIYKMCIEIMEQHPFLGIGAEGLQGLGYTDLSPHNTYLELLLYYGYFFGGGIIAILVFLWIQGIIYKRDESLRSMVIIWFSLYVARSFTGAGVLTSINFWILLALCLRVLQKRLSDRNEKGA